MPGKALCKCQNMTGTSFTFLGAFAKLQKAIVSIVMSCLSVCLVAMEQFFSNWKDFHEILYLGIFENIFG